VVKGIEEAVAALKRDPAQPVTAEIDGLVVELRYKGEGPVDEAGQEKERRTADDLFREVGPWEGETYEEITELLRDSQTGGGSEDLDAAQRLRAHREEGRRGPRLDTRGALRAWPASLTRTCLSIASIPASQRSKQWPRSFCSGGSRAGLFASRTKLSSSSTPS
jgi:hypothetical protein